MLQSLSIRNVVLIDRLDLELGPGLCALTGETGAGKSILLDALGLALGARADAGLLREGAERGAVSAAFSLPAGHVVHAALADHGFESSEPIVVRRTLGADGRSRAYIDDQLVSVGLLRDIGSKLVEVQGQREQIGLLDAATHRRMVDAFGGNGSNLDAVAADFDAWQTARETERAAEADLTAARRDEDFLRHALSELQQLDPRPGEDAELAAQRSRMMHGQKLTEAIVQAQASLGEGDGIEARLGGARRIIGGVADLAGGALAALSDALDRAAIETAEAINALEAAANALNLDPAHLDAVEERLFALRAAARKHATEPDALPALQVDLAARLASLEQGDDRLREAAALTKAAAASFEAAAKRLSAKRRKAAASLDTAIARELAPLRLDGAVFRTELVDLPMADATRHGLDAAAFKVAMNPGASLSPLQRVVSGGELSRLLLALKVVLAGAEAVPTLVFDEVDHGIGGATAQAVGDRLAGLARSVQILVVTHSPQVAAQADCHLRVIKQDRGGGTVTLLDRLTEQTRREEIARMLAGARVTDEARAAADRLIDGPAP